MRRETSLVFKIEKLYSLAKVGISFSPFFFLKLNSIVRKTQDEQEREPLAWPNKGTILLCMDTPHTCTNRFFGHHIVGHCMF